MCFSALASFSTAAVTGVIGLATLSRTDRLSEAPLAAMPLIFAVQQAIEGALWLTLPSMPESAASADLILLFLFIALVFWPIYVSIAVLLIEPSEHRRRSMLACLAVGAGMGGYLLWTVLVQSHGAAIVNDHIVYATGQKHTLLVGLIYLAAAGLPLVLSSRRILTVFGAIVLVGSATAFVFYWQAFVSVWCFFAGAASVVLLFHFESARRQRQQPVPYTA